MLYSIQFQVKKNTHFLAMTSGFLMLYRKREHYLLTKYSIGLEFLKADNYNFLLLEPYYGGSHRAFIRGLCKHLDISFTLISLPARKWKMRMQLSAPWFANEILGLYKSGNTYDGILTSSFLDVPVLRSLLQQKGLLIPLAVYFHENQFAYPEQVSSNKNFQFTSLNFNTALGADTVAFNSCYNKKTFIDGVRFYLKKATDIDVKYLATWLDEKSLVLYPGIDYSVIDREKQIPHRDSEPVIVWNHRWEHDKDPETFFQVLFSLVEENIAFKLIVLGQSFRNQPDIFKLAVKLLHDRIIHIGYVKSRDEYADLLGKSDIVVSTAKHEFFGMAVLEAVRAGCIPLVPDRLAYRELFPDKYRYHPGDLKARLKTILTSGKTRMKPDEINSITQHASWPDMAVSYRNWLTGLVN